MDLQKPVRGTTTRGSKILWLALYGSLIRRKELSFDFNMMQENGHTLPNLRLIEITLQLSQFAGSEKVDNFVASCSLTMSPPLITRRLPQIQRSWRWNKLRRGWCGYHALPLKTWPLLSQAICICIAEVYKALPSFHSEYKNLRPETLQSILEKTLPHLPRQTHDSVGHCTCIGKKALSPGGYRDIRLPPRCNGSGWEISLQWLPLSTYSPL